MQRLTGAAVIVLAFVLAGASLVSARRERLSTLRGLCAALLQLQGELSARLTPLPEIITALCGSGEKNTAAFFAHISSRLSELGEQSFREIWRSAAEELSMLEENEHGELAALGEMLGIYSISDELCAIELCRKRLEERRDEAERALTAYRRSCFGLCVAFGSLLAIVLI